MIKDILVHVDSERTCEMRLEAAASFARRHEAHLVGLFPLELPDLPGYVTAQIGADALARARTSYLEHAARAQRMFEEIAGRLGVRCEWRQETGSPIDLLALHGRYADVVVVSQPDLERGGALEMTFPAELALAGGRPILALPYAGTHLRIGERVLVAWNASREAARAVHDALPILCGAQSVVVLAVDPPDRDHLPGADISAHLARHGATVESRHSIAPDIEVGDELLNMASDLGSDLIVMGAYGRSRLREAVFGGVTRHILRFMTVPVLMSH